MQTNEYENKEDLLKIIIAIMKDYPVESVDDDNFNEVFGETINKLIQTTYDVLLEIIYVSNLTDWKDLSDELGPPDNLMQLAYLAIYNLRDDVKDAWNEY